MYLSVQALFCDAAMTKLTLLDSTINGVILRHIFISTEYCYSAKQSNRNVTVAEMSDFDLRKYCCFMKLTEQMIHSLRNL